MDGRSVMKRQTVMKRLCVRKRKIIVTVRKRFTHDDMFSPH